MDGKHRQIDAAQGELARDVVATGYLRRRLDPAKAAAEKMKGAFKWE